MSAFMCLLLRHGQQQRRILVCGAGAQDVRAITLLKSAWPIHPSLFRLSSSSHGGRSSGEIIRCSSSSVWGRRPSPSANDAPVNSGEAHAIEQLWEEHFADPSQWWDNRLIKRNPNSPDFKHKVTRKTLWVDGWSTPSWVKAMLKSATSEGSLQSHVCDRTRDSQDMSIRNRFPKSNNGKTNTLPNSARELGRIGYSGDGSMLMQSARTTSEAIAILKNRLERGIANDSYMYVEVLKRCLKQKDLIAAKQVHGCIIKSRVEQNIFVVNNLLSVYTKCGRLKDARQVFDELVKKSIYSWTIMIGGYTQHNHAKDAMEIFNQMCHEGVQPNEITYMNILKACASPSALKWGKEVHAHIKNGSLESDVFVGTALLKMYTKCGCIKEARQSFDKLTNRDVISWNVMMGAYAESGSGPEAYELFLQMKQEGFKPDAFTYTSILNACASGTAGALEWGKEVHIHAIEAGLGSNLRVGNALVHMYAKSGSIGDAQRVFDRMEERDVITWTVMIGGLAQHGCGVEAYELFLLMQKEGYVPDTTTYVSILNACASAGSLKWVKEVHSRVVERGFESDLSRICEWPVRLFTCTQRREVSTTPKEFLTEWRNVM